MKGLRAGFSLLELMMAVVILSVLAVVATASYVKYMRRARVQEAISVLGDVRIRQELYFQSNSRYACADETCGCPSNAFWPTTPDPCDSSTDIPVSVSVNCNSVSSFPAQAWCQMGLDPNGEHYFKYFFEGWDGSAGASKTDCSGISTCNIAGDTSGCYALDITKPWWFAVAHGNLDRDPHMALSTFYISSALKQVVMFNEID
jgi:prepilin-type N-terminal cleavage/methylation domain-containing protein